MNPLVLSDCIKEVCQSFLQSKQIEFILCGNQRWYTSSQRFEMLQDLGRNPVGVLSVQVCLQLYVQKLKHAYCTHRSMGCAHSQRVFSAGYDGRRLGIHNGINRRLLRLCSLVRRPSSSHPRHKPRHRRGRHRLHPGSVVGNRKRHHLLQPEHRRTWHHQGTCDNNLFILLISILINRSVFINHVGHLFSRVFVTLWM